MDTQKSLLTYLWGVLTGDTDLKTAMGGTVRCYLTWAKPDAEFPYLVHRFDSSSGEPFPNRRGAYYLDIWSDSSNADEILAIRVLIIALLDELRANTTDVKNIKLSLQTDGFIPESEQGIWHYAMQFNLNLWRQTETLAIIGR